MELQRQISERLLPLKDVIAKVGFKKTFIYKHIKLGTFPKPYMIHGENARWKESELDAWIRIQTERPAGKGDEQYYR